MISRRKEMRILHITPSYWPATVYGGPTVSVTQLCRQQSALDHQVHVMTTTANGKDDFPVKNNKVVFDKGVSVQYFRRYTGDHSHFAPALLWQLFRRCRRYDVVHIHSWWNLVAIPAVFICHLCRVRPVISPRGMLNTYSLPTRTRRFFHRTIGKWLLRRTVLHTTSRHEERDALSFLPEWPGFVLPNMIEFPALKKVQSSDSPMVHNPFRILFLGRVHPIKRLELVFEALSHFTAPWQMHIAGEGEANYLQSLSKSADEIGISDRLVWHGWVDAKAKTHLLEASDILVQTSHHENFSNAVLEALAMGTPVLLTESVGLADYVQARHFGWVCRPTASDISQILNAVISGNQTLPFSRQHIARQVRKDFEESSLTQRYIDAYNKYCRPSI